MNKQIVWIEDREPRKIPRADVPPTHGYTMVVDGHFKSCYDDEAAARQAGLELLRKFPMLQIRIYDAAEKTQRLLK